MSNDREPVPIPEMTHLLTIRLFRDWGPFSTRGEYVAVGGGKEARANVASYAVEACAVKVLADG